ncbi:hypothetical protein V6N12_028278 [Hibiscus sabdariffa]|uniref:Uncharacterized protein n=1 Tax=Hibiscus sabdariffa TaxID=183260 RepID=A0ABR2F5B9_9ROSI
MALEFSVSSTSRLGTKVSARHGGEAVDRRWVKANADATCNLGGKMAAAEGVLRNNLYLPLVDDTHELLSRKWNVIL